MNGKLILPNYGKKLEIIRTSELSKTAELAGLKLNADRLDFDKLKKNFLKKKTSSNWPIKLISTLDKNIIKNLYDCLRTKTNATYSSKLL